MISEHTQGEPAEMISLRKAERDHPAAMAQVAAHVAWLFEQTGLRFTPRIAYATARALTVIVEMPEMEGLSDTGSIVIPLVPLH